MPVELTNYETKAINEFIDANRAERNETAQPRCNNPISVSVLRTTLRVSFPMLLGLCTGMLALHLYGVAKGPDKSITSKGGETLVAATDFATSTVTLLTYVAINKLLEYCWPAKLEKPCDEESGLLQPSRISNYGTTTFTTTMQ